MTKAKEMINQAVEILVANEMERSQGHGLFSCFEDLRVEDVEILEFLLSTCPETIVTLDHECKKLWAEYPGFRFGAFTAITNTRIELDKKYHFGFMNRSKVEVLDNITDISQIPMKERHIVYLDKLRAVKLDVDSMLIKAFNQIQQHLNPFRIDQCLSYLHEELEYEGIKTSYSDYSKANPHNLSKPYFCRSNWGYYITDTIGGYDGSLYISQWPGEKAQWSYMSSKYANGWHTYKSMAEAQVTKLRELNAIANIEGLDWKIEFKNQNDLEFKQGEYNHAHQDFPKGKVTLHKKMERGILRDHKLSRRSA